MVRFGLEVPSLRKRIAARTSIKRLVRNKLGLRAPRGWGWITNPRKAAYIRVYYRTTRGGVILIVAMACGVGTLGLVLVPRGHGGSEFRFAGIVRPRAGVGCTHR